MQWLYYQNIKVKSLNPQGQKSNYLRLYSFSYMHLQGLFKKLAYVF